MSAPPSFDDQTDFDNAERGFVAALTPGVIKAADGRVVWNSDAYAFLDRPGPDTANPSLWRQGQLCSKQGLFQVTDGIYQVRDLDLSNVSFVEGDSGVIVIDPLISTECAAAALSLYREQRGDRPVTAVIYTHSHVDHFGGVRGVVPDGADIPIIASAGFLEHAVNENVYAGTAMTRRAVYRYGSGLPRGAAGQIGCGLGITTSTGTVSLIPPTLDITRTGQEEVVDGVRMVFQLTPGTEAPSEMNFYFTDKPALCAAENATHNQHNLLTLGGAVVGNPGVWASYLTETIELFGGQADVLFASHHWPTWGQQQIKASLTKQRDRYAYQDWFDGNTAHRWELPPVEAAKKHVEYMGGAEAIIAKVKAEDDDPRWAAQVLNYVVFADPDNARARELLADAHDGLLRMLATQRGSLHPREGVVRDVEPGPGGGLVDLRPEIDGGEIPRRRQLARPLRVTEERVQPQP